MAQPIFFRGRKLTEGLIESLWQENRIVAKSVPPSRKIDNCSCDDAFKHPDSLAALCEGQNATKARRSLVLPRAGLRKFAQ